MDLFYKIQTTEVPLQKSTILVLPFSRDEFLDKLAKSTLTTCRNHSSSQSESYLFCGKIDKQKFKILRKSVHGVTFLPILEGYVEDTKRGCIVFLHYKLFNNIKQFFFFALLFILCVSGYFFFIKEEPMNTFLCFLFISLNYAVAHVNFRRQVRLTHQELIKVIES
ncbi:MAG: hypothetical protein NZM38_07320 [Cytophagales bacterium]|nr:hypothetical protein [Cytophagales bacterium]MDW8384567.1 hypothetical protein [Flammeovirgaceae bacterium]